MTTPHQELIAECERTAVDVAWVLGDTPTAKLLRRCADALRQQKAIVDSLESASAAEWRDIASAPKDEELVFWIVPKTAEEAWQDSSGKPITCNFEPYRHIGKYGSWSAISKAVLWAPLPVAPSPKQEKDK